MQYQQIATCKNLFAILAAACFGLVLAVFVALAGWVAGVCLAGLCRTFDWQYGSQLILSLTATAKLFGVVWAVGFIIYSLDFLGIKDVAGALQRRNPHLANLLHLPKRRHHA